MIVPRRNHAGILGIGHTKNMGNGLKCKKKDYYWQENSSADIKDDRSSLPLCCVL